MYVIKQWAQHFENNRSRELKNLTWVAMPNRHDTVGYRTLISLPDGPALYGTWCVLVQIASKCNPRGTLVLANGTPHTPESLSIKSGISSDLIAHCLQIIQSPAIDWIDNKLTNIEETIPQEGAGIPQEGAGIPQEGAGIPQEGAGRARAERTDGRREGKGKKVVLAGEPTIRDIPDALVGSLVVGPSNLETSRAVREAFAETDDGFIFRLVERTQTHVPDAPDVLIAQAVRECWKHSRQKQTSAGLFLQTVPQCVKTWMTAGKLPPEIPISEKTIQTLRFSQNPPFVPAPLPLLPPGHKITVDPELEAAVQNLAVQKDIRNARPKPR